MTTDGYRSAHQRVPGLDLGTYPLRVQAFHHNGVMLLTVCQACCELIMTNEENTDFGIGEETDEWRRDAERQYRERGGESVCQRGKGGKRTTATPASYQLLEF